MDMTMMDIPYEVTEMLEEFGPMIIGIVLIVLLVVLAVSAVFYIFQSLGLYTIAKRRGIENPWLAWIPVANYWILGCISDQYRYVVRGEVKSKRKVLLTVSILNAVLSIVAFVRLIVSIVLMITGAAQGINEMEIIRQLLTSLAFYIPVLILGIVGLVVQIMALFDVYTSCDPANNVLYLVLSLIPGISQVTKPLFLFLCRDQDKGMPPRRESPVENPAEF